jgi:hypothetical protein
MPIDPDEDLEVKLVNLQKRVRLLPDNQKEVGEKALELCQRPDITMPEYVKQMRSYPGLRTREEARINTSLLIVAMLAERIVIYKESKYLH